MKAAMKIKKKGPRLLALHLALLAAAAQAQLVDDVEIRREGEDAVLQVRFVTPVQLLRSLSARSGDLGQVYYDLLPTREPLNLAISSERRLPAGARSPLLILTDEAAGGAERSRKLVLRFSANTPFVARSTQGGRSIELVLRGQGAALAGAGTPAAATLPAGASISLILQRSDSQEAAGAVPVPALLQDYSISQRSRVVDGKTVIETLVSGIKTAAEAQALLVALRPRFPLAAIAAPETAPAPMPGPTPTLMPAPDSQAQGKAEALLAAARQAIAAGEHQQAINQLDELLALPPSSATQEAQELIAQARWRQGDPERARAEYELYLKLYPQGAGAERAREALLTLAPPVQQALDAGTQPAVTTTLSGSLSSFYYGGQSKIRTQDFQDSPLSGLPELVSDATLSNTDQKQLISSVDINWRRRDADSDLRLVLRDSYSADLLRSDKSKNKLSALYADYRLQSQGISLRMGRQSPTGAGVMGRFDGAQIGYRFKPKWRVNAVAGRPSDSLLQSQRHFYGASLDADELAKGVGGSVYLIEQRIDGEIDRRGVGSELRFLAGNLSASGMLDYDSQLRGLNIASLQATWISEQNMVVNALYDRRSTPMLMLGNSLFFQNPVLGVQASRLAELLASQSLALLRQQVRDTTAYSTQAMLSVSRPVSANWQLGADLRLTNVGALLPVPDILPNGQPGTGNIWSGGLQLIGSNLYSARDTHVLVLSLLKGLSYTGKLLSYNNSSSLGGGWQLEPALRYYLQNDSNGTRSQRWAPGLRVTFRASSKLALESELSMEFSDISGPNRNESSNRSFWYFGLRYDL